MANVAVTVVRLVDAGQWETLASMSLPAEMIPREGEYISIENGKCDRLEHGSVVTYVRWDYRAYQADSYNFCPGDEPVNPDKIKVEIQIA